MTPDDDLISMLQQECAEAMCAAIRLALAAMPQCEREALLQRAAEPELPLEAA